MKRIHKRLTTEGRLKMSDLFASHTNRSKLVGLFLATLELVRHHGVHLEQGELFEEIWILPGAAAEKPLEISAADNYDPGASDQPTAETAPKLKPGRKSKQKKPKEEE